MLQYLWAVSLLAINRLSHIWEDGGSLMKSCLAACKSLYLSAKLSIKVS